MNKSENLIELAKALNIFQGKLKAVKKDGVNPFFKMHYATLDAIWEAIREPLSSSGLAVTQTLGQSSDGKTLLDTTLLHTSGEWISGSMVLNPVKDDPQGLGSAISYARRYSLCAMLGVVADEDDDANAATKLKPTPESEERVKPKGHWCSKHNVVFFKKGRMKNYAHKIEGTDEWCNEEQPKIEPTAQSDEIVLWDNIKPTLSELYSQKSIGWAIIDDILAKLFELGADISSKKVQASFETLDDNSKKKFAEMIKSAS